MPMENLWLCCDGKKLDMGNGVAEFKPIKGVGCYSFVSQTKDRYQNCTRVFPADKGTGTLSDEGVNQRNHPLVLIVEVNV